MGGLPKIGCLPPKMDGENNGSNPIKHGMIWGYPYFWVDTHIMVLVNSGCWSGQNLVKSLLEKYAVAANCAP